MSSFNLMGGKWGQGKIGTPGGQVTWSFATSPGQFFQFDASIIQPEYQALIRDAFLAWESVANIDLVEVTDSGSANIRLGWDAIDGKGNTLGEEYGTWGPGTDIGSALRAEIRFDTAEAFSLSKTIQHASNFYALALHEIGHALGFAHTDDIDSLMFPVIGNTVTLSEDEIAGAHALYGAPAAVQAKTLGVTLDRVAFQFSRDDALVDVIQGGVEVTHHGETDVLFDIERLEFNDGWIGLDIDGAAGQAYRIYQAAFARTPDNDGLKFWIDKVDNGMSLHQVGQHFVASAEFQSIYGTNVSNADFIDRLYDNILGRDGDEGGFDFWVGELDSGRRDKSSVLAGFSESAENVALVGGAIEDGIWVSA